MSNIIEQSIDTYVSKSLIDFGKGVNTERQLVLVNDGLKPVYRRVIYTAMKVAPKLTKTASISGQCFTGDTSIIDVNGVEIKFKDLCDLLNHKSVYTFSVDSEGGIEVTKIKRCWITGNRGDLVKITLDNDKSFTCTRDHLIMMIDGKYKSAGSLSVGDSLMPLYLIDDEDRGGLPRRSILSNGSYQYVYKLASMHSDCIKDPECDYPQIHHVDYNTMNDEPCNLHIMDRSDHLSLHAAQGYGTKALHEYNTSGRLSERNSINWTKPEYREYMIDRLVTRTRDNFREATIKIINWIKSRGLTADWSTFCNYKNEAYNELYSLNEIQGKVPSYILNYFEEDELAKVGFDIDSIPKYADFSYFDEDLHDLYHYPQVYFTIKSIYDAGYSEITPELWTKYAYCEKLEGYSVDLIKKYIKLIYHFNLTPKIYWYPEYFRSDGKNSPRCHQLFNNIIITLENAIKAGVKFNELESRFNEFVPDNGCYYYKALQTYPTCFTEECYLNLGRLIPVNHKVKKIEFLSDVEEVYDLEVDSDLHNFPLSAGVFVHNCIATVHPHSSDAVDSVISALVRWGIFDSQGNHGMKMIYGQDISPAASRYTEAKLSDKWKNIFNEMMPYVPYHEAEIEGNVEPEYLPTPVPLVLLFSGLGIGFGVNARYPMFTAKSMLEALTHDDPNLLEAPKGLIIDHANSELDELWNTGLGRICYKFEVTKCGISSGYGSMISGSPEIFKPNLEKAFEEELAKGQVYILDQTSGDIPKVFIGRSPNVRAISLDDIQDTCEQVCQMTKMFRLTVAGKSEVYLIPLKTWLKECFDNYVELVIKYKNDSINKLKFEYDVYTWLPIITKCLMDNRQYNDEELSKKNNCDIEIVRAIMRKSISTLRNVDSVDKLKGIQANIKQFESLDPVKYTLEYYNKL